MKRSSHFLIGFAAAAITFGSLMAALGPDKFGSHCGRFKGGCHHSYHHGHHGHGGCYNACNAHKAH